MCYIPELQRYWGWFTAKRHSQYVVKFLRRIRFLCVMLVAYVTLADLCLLNQVFSVDCSMLVLNKTLFFEKVHRAGLFVFNTSQKDREEQAVTQLPLPT